MDAALRVLMMQFRLPGEAQQIDRILEKFASRYHEMNPGVFLNADTAFVLAFSIIMLNTDLHNQSITPDKKMTLEQFVRNNRGINQGKDISKEVLEKIYISVRDDEIRMDEADMYESEVVAFMAPTKSGWLSKKSESILGHWKRHWFVLNDGCLYYFINPSDEGKMLAWCYVDEVFEVVNDLFFLSRNIQVLAVLFHSTILELAKVLPALTLSLQVPVAIM